MRIILSVLFTISYLFSVAQINVDLISNVDFTADNGSGSDIWGYVAPDGTEYAVVGARQGTYIYSLEDPANPIERKFIPGSSSTWRDMKQWGEYVYVTADSGTDGLLVIDMTQAPETIESVYRNTTIGENLDITMETCHNIYIDENGMIYLAGCEGRGTDFFDPNQDPWDPVYLGGIAAPYHHDAYVKGDTLYASRILVGDLTMFDVSDKTNPIELGSVTTSSDFTHNAWADPTNSYAFTTDERAEGFVDAYDVSDPGNIEFLDKFQVPGTAGTGTIPHNTHYHNGYLVTSWYTSGLIVIDANKPDNLVQVAQYDTYNGPDGGFSGCWGTTPYLPSGIVIASDINSGLYVFNVDYIRACYLEGAITDINTNATIPNVEIRIVDGDYDEDVRSMANGEYKTGQPTPGTFTVEYSHPLYESAMAEVTLENGIVTIQDIQLGSKPTYNVTFEVKDELTQNPIANAQISLFNEGISYDFKTDDTGTVIGEVVDGNYDVFTGIWGHENKGSQVNVTSDQTVTFELAEAYMDDFVLDLGWSVENFEETGGFTGAWELAVPAGTYANGNIVNPEIDNPFDLGNKCYVTENEVGGTSFSSDVDDGNTTLISPTMDLSGYLNPSVEFSLWWVAAGGNGQPDDQLEISIDNGIEEVVILEYSQNVQEWTNLYNIVLSDFVTITNDMRLKVKTGDTDANGHIVEAGFDDFMVINGPVSTTTSEFNKLNIYPTPASNQLFIENNAENITKIELINSLGQTVMSKDVDNSTAVLDITGFNSGNYFARVQLANNEILIQSVQIIK